MFVVRSHSLPDFGVPAFKTSALITTGQEDLSSGRHMAALKHFDQALSQADDTGSPLTEQARLGRAHALYGLGRDEEALHCLTQLHNTPPGSLATAIKIAEILFSLGRHDDAEKTLQTAVEQEPENVAILGQLALLSEHHGRQEQALNYVQRALTLQPLNPDLLHLHGSLLCKHGRHADGIESLARAAQEQPANTHVLVKYGRALEISRQYDKAETIFARTLALNPNQPNVFLLYARTLLKRGQAEVALGVINRGVSLWPRNPELLHFRATACLLTKRFDQCLDDSNLVVQLAPQWHAGFNVRGILHLTRQEAWLALPDLEQAIALAPNNARVRANHARALLCLGQGEAAQASLDAAHLLDPKDSELLALTQWLQDRRDGKSGPHPGYPAPPAHSADDSAMESIDNQVANTPPAPSRKRRAPHGKPPLPPSAKQLKVAHQIRVSQSAPQLSLPQDLATLGSPPSHWVPV